MNSPKPSSSSSASSSPSSSSMKPLSALSGGAVVPETMMGAFLNGGVRGADGVPNISDVAEDLHSMYLKMNTDERARFRRIYLSLWRYVVNFERMESMVFLSDLDRLLSSYKPVLTLRQFQTLTTLYLLSDRGALPVNLPAIPMDILSKAERYNITLLQSCGLLVRMSHNPLKPHYKPETRGKAWLIFTAAGMDYYGRILLAQRQNVSTIYFNAMISRPSTDKRRVKKRP